MPKIASIPTSIEATTGYGYAAIVNDVVVAFHSLEIGEASELVGVDAQAEIAILSAQDAVKAAKDADEKAWQAYQDSGYDDDAVDYEAVSMSVRFGMASGGKFTHTFSKGEAKAARLPKGWQ